MSVTTRCKTISFSAAHLDAIEKALKERIVMLAECLAFNPRDKLLQIENTAALEALAIVMDAEIEPVPA